MLSSLKQHFITISHDLSIDGWFSLGVSHEVSVGKHLGLESCAVSAGLLTRWLLHSRVWQHSAPLHPPWWQSSPMTDFLIWNPGSGQQEAGARSCYVISGLCLELAHNHFYYFGWVKIFTGPARIQGARDMEFSPPFNGGKVKKLFRRAFRDGIHNRICEAFTWPGFLPHPLSSVERSMLIYMRLLILQSIIFEILVFLNNFTI